MKLSWFENNEEGCKKREPFFFKKILEGCTIHNYNKLGYSSDKFYSESKTTVDL